MKVKCWCNSGRKWKKCHFPTFNPVWTEKEISKFYSNHWKIHLKNDDEISKIAHSCRIASNILDELCENAKEGTTLAHLDHISKILHEKNGAIPAPLGYGKPPFPGTICTSINSVICHGIPNDYILKNGDILNIDVTTIVDGYFGDCSRMVCIGNVSDNAKKLVDVSKECLEQSIKKIKPGMLISDIGRIIEPIAHKNGMSVVHQFVGHGIGKQFHEMPSIFHCTNDIDIPLVKGMTFTIEPMINEGKPGAIISNIDKWTAYTVDNKLSAQWEHTVFISNDECIPLTSH